MATVIGEELAGQAAPAPARAARRRRSLPVWRWVILLLTAIYFLIPLYAALRFAGIASFGDVVHQTGFSDALILSLKLAVITTVLTMALMVPTTIYVHLRLPYLRRLLESVTILPIVIPPVVLIVGVLQVAPAYLKSTPYLLGLVYVILAMPFAYRSLDAGLRALDIRTLVDASSSLGAGWLTTLWRVILPNLRTALLSATVLTVALVLGEFTIASLDLYQTFPVWIVNFDQTSGPVSTAASLLALFVTWLFLMLIVTVGSRRARRTGGGQVDLAAVVRQETGRPGMGGVLMVTNIGAGTAASVTSRAASGGAPVSLQDVSRSFGAVRALSGLSLEIAPGELVALLGPSGCGKTAALRILAGFEVADSGTVSVDGKNVAAVPPAKRDMGMVFQSYSLFPNMSALENVGFGLRMRKLRPADRRRRAAEQLDLVGLSEQASQFPHQLSGGQQQRVALARALAIEPRVLLLDEPLSALDAKVRLQLREQIRSLQQRLGITTLFVTHDQEEALSMADRVGVMKDGMLAQLAVPSELYTRPATAFVAEFVGTMNRIPGNLGADGQVSALGSVAEVLDSCADVPPGAVDVMARPESLRVAAVAGGNGIVTSWTFRGSVTGISVRLSGDLTVRVDVASTAAAVLLPGASVQVSLDGSPVLVTERT